MTDVQPPSTLHGLPSAPEDEEAVRGAAARTGAP